MNANDEALTFERPLSGPDAASNAAASLGRFSTSTLSMRKKKERKKHASAHHNSNFHAGYVPVVEEVLHKSGIRGRKRYFLYSILAVLLFVALLNTLVIAWLLYFFGMTHNGLAGMEIINLPNRSSLFHVFVPAFISTLQLDGAPLGSQYNANISFTSQNSPLYVNTFQSSNFSQGITLNENNITVVTDDMRIKSGKREKWLSLNFETLASVYGLNNINFESLTTRKVKNYKNFKDIYLESTVNKVEISGSEAVNVKSKEYIDATGIGILLQSDKRVIFQSNHSVYLDTELLRQVPVFSPRSKHQPGKLCMCGNGQLFLVRSSYSLSCDIGKRMALSVCHTKVI